MRAYIVRRLLAMLATLLGVSVIVFGLMRLIPGTVVEQLLGQSALVGEETIRSLRQFFGLDRPWYVQYVEWIGGVARGDLGMSWRSHRPVGQLIVARLPVSAELAVLAVAWSLLLGVPLGAVAAVRRGRPSDSAVRFASTLGLSVPAFWQGTLLILLFSVYLQWMPSLQWVSLLRDPLGNLGIIALPALTLGTATAAMISRMTRSAMLDVLGRDYIRTARAKGVAEPRVVTVHALRNALIPVVTVAGVQMGYILGGIVVVEDVFNLPGVGRLLLDAIFQRDYPVVQGTILVGAALFMGLNFLVDLLYAVIDPRITYA
ncbi:MAG: ABC transporter permease [Armatimonadota bacterium]|nr:ABC transporter permease [Armatimonadota bacterium]MDR7531720.1 ABC transporter permease [Armatimonadota bacterium]MDR7534936.1 ABC transporter permease [Armatimonadota bacterium]